MKFKEITQNSLGYYQSNNGLFFLREDSKEKITNKINDIKKDGINCIFELGGYGKYSGEYISFKLNINDTKESVQVMFDEFMLERGFKYAGDEARISSTMISYCEHSNIFITRRYNKI